MTRRSRRCRRPVSSQVAVRNPAPGGGTSNTRIFTMASPHAGNPIPVVDMVSPNTIDYGSPAQALTVYGSGFVPASVVRLNGMDRPTVYHGSGGLRVSLSAADLATARTYGLTVFNPAPGGGTSNVAQVHVRVCCFDLLYEGPAGGRRELLKLPISSVWTAPLPLLTGVEAREPSASPDGRHVAFTGVDAEGGTDIYVVNLATRELQRLTFTGASDQPAWSGQRIAYRRPADGHSSIWVASSLSTPASGPWVHERLSPPGVDDERPSWSLTGERIAFASNTGGSKDIWVMNPDGTGRRRITSAAARETEPTWSPDGLIIAYTHIDAGGAASIRLTASGEGWVIINEPLLAAGRLPAWSPDGQWIAFATDADGREDVGLIRPDGTGRVVLTATFDGGTAPAWIRLPR